MNYQKSKNKKPMEKVEHNQSLLCKSVFSLLFLKVLCKILAKVKNISEQKKQFERIKNYSFADLTIIHYFCVGHDLTI